MHFCEIVGCLTSQQYASVSQGWICSDNFTCCHTEIETTDQTVYLTQSQYTDTRPTSPSTDPIMPGAWQGSHWSASFYVTGMTRPRKNPSASGIRIRDFPLSRRTPQPLGQRGLSVRVCLPGSASMYVSVDEHDLCLPVGLSACLSVCLPARLPVWMFLSLCIQSAPSSCVTGMLTMNDVSDVRQGPAFTGRPCGQQEKSVLLHTLALLSCASSCMSSGFFGLFVCFFFC